MSELIQVNGNTIERLEYKGQPVITLKMVDELHQRPAGTARKRFNDNRKRFIEGEDFYNVPYEEWKETTGRNSSVQKNGGRKGNITFLTETGYLMLVKSFQDDLAWKIQKELVKVYFSAKALLSAPEPLKQLPSASAKKFPSASVLREAISLCRIAGEGGKAGELAESLLCRYFDISSPPPLPPASAPASNSLPVNFTIKPDDSLPPAPEGFVWSFIGDVLIVMPDKSSPQKDD